MPPITLPWSFDTLTPDGLIALAASAERLGRAAASAGLPQLLRGKRLALLSDDHDSPAAAAFTKAATELGAHVARVPQRALPAVPADEEAHPIPIGLLGASAIVPIPQNLAQLVQQPRRRRNRGCGYHDQLGCCIYNQYLVEIAC